MSARAEQERIYSTNQLVAASKSAVNGLKDQLQVLSILDGTCMAWPGVSQALADLQVIAEMASSRLSQSESAVQAADAQVKQLQSQAKALKGTLAASQKEKERLENDLRHEQSRGKELAQSLDRTKDELQRSKKDFWDLERQRADLANELDKVRGEKEFVEGELAGLRGTASSQAEQISGLKEELSARRTDVQHLGRQLHEAGDSLAHLRGQVETLQRQQQDLRGELKGTTADRDSWKAEAQRFGATTQQLGESLGAAEAEIKKLKEWKDIVKKVGDDKLEEERAAHASTRQQLEAQVGSMELALGELRGQLQGSHERVAARERELQAQGKEVALLTLQVKDMRKTLDKEGEEKMAVARAREAADASAAKLKEELVNAMRQIDKLNSEQQQLKQQLQTAIAQKDKEGAAKSVISQQLVKSQQALQELQLQLERAKGDLQQAESRGREQSAAEQGKVIDAGRDAAVFKARAEGWKRDADDLRARVGQSEAAVRQAQEEREAAMRQVEAARLEAAKAVAAAEQQVLALKEEVRKKDEEVKKVVAHAASKEHTLQQTIDRMRRENDAGNLELTRLAHGGPSTSGSSATLPPLPVDSYQVGSIQDQLERVRRLLTAVSSKPGSSTGGPRPMPGKHPPGPGCGGELKVPTNIPKPRHTTR